MRPLLLLLVVLALSTPVWAASSLEVVLPNQSATGVPFSFTVTARTGAAVDPSYVGTVHFTSSDPGATLPGDYTFTLADAGTHTFSATMNTAGQGAATVNQTITATDTVTSSITGTHHTNVKWGPDVVVRFGVEAPETVTRTVAFDFTVSALNTDFQVVTSYTGTVHFEASPGTTLPSDFTFTGADNGVHTFSMSASRGGDHLVTARDVAAPLVDGGDSFYVVCPELTASASNSGPVCAESTVVLYGSSNQSDVTYHWQGPRHGLSPWTDSGQNPTAPAPAAGEYLLEVRNAIGCEATAMTTVEAFAVPTMLTSTNVQACERDTVNIAVNNPSAFSDFVWTRNYGAETLPDTTSSITVVPNANTAYTVRGKHVATGCNAGPNTIVVDVDPKFPVTLIVPEGGCPNETLSAMATADADSSATIVWSLTNATLTEDNGWSIEFEPTGLEPVTITAIVDNEFGTCETMASAVIPISGDDPDIVTQPQSVTISRGESTTLSVLASGTILRYDWYRGVSGDRQHRVSTGPQASYTTPPLGRTTGYWVDVVSDCGSTTSATAIVTVPSKRRAARH